MNPLQQLQEDAVNYLLGNPATANVGYESFRKQAMDSAVRQSLAGWSVRVPGKIGVYCLVLMPAFFVEDPNVPGVQGSVELTIRTFEDPKINNTGLTAEDVALANLRWFGDGLVIAGLLAIYPSTKRGRAQAELRLSRFPGLRHGFARAIAAGLSWPHRATRHHRR